jgi:hypothetical protein
MSTPGGFGKTFVIISSQKIEQIPKQEKLLKISAFGKQKPKTVSEISNIFPK